MITRYKVELKISGQPYQEIVSTADIVGYWVKASDAELLVARIERLERQLEEARHWEYLCATKQAMLDQISSIIHRDD